MKKTLGISIGLALLLVIPASFAARGQTKGIASAPAAETQENLARVDTVDSKRESYRRYAQNNRGEAARGMQLFLAKNCACLTCHGEPGQGGNVGPDLHQVGSRHTRDSLITAILEPSKFLVPGYGEVFILTHDGQELLGDFVKETPDAIHLTDKQGSNRVPRSAIAELCFRSPMPGGLEEFFKPEEFADLVAYLESLN
jgi:putative heme-binding domain-containing protein